MMAPLGDSYYPFKRPVVQDPLASHRRRVVLMAWVGSMAHLRTFRLTRRASIPLRHFVDVDFALLEDGWQVRRDFCSSTA